MIDLTLGIHTALSSNTDQQTSTHTPTGTTNPEMVLGSSLVQTSSWFQVAVQATQIGMALVTKWSSDTKAVVQPLGIHMALVMTTGVMDINTDLECYRAMQTCPPAAAWAR